MENLFSHVPAPSETATPEASSNTLQTAVYVQLDLSLEESWLAFTEYTHLWWPHQLKRNGESYIEIGERLLLEETEGGGQIVLGETQYFAIQDVIAIQTHPGELNETFKSGVSFVFEKESEKSSTVEICSGLIKPRDLDDLELGVSAEDLAAAQLLLSGFTRFMKTPLIVEDLSSN